MGQSDLFCGNNPRLIKEKIIEYIVNMKKMEKLGYSIKGSIVKYSDFGASTSRRRLIIFGTLTGSARSFFDKLERKKTNPLTVKDVIWDLRSKGTDNG